MSDKVSGGAAGTKTKRVFLLSGTVNRGRAVCYQWDAVGVTAENDSVTALGTAISDWSDARDIIVEKPDYFNKKFFAGVVAKGSDGVIGPNWIDIHLPGSVCDIFTHAVTSVGPVGSVGVGQTLTFGFALDSSGVLQNQGEFMGQGFPGEGSATVLQEGVASSYVMAKLQDGPPSGGYQEVATNSLMDYTVSCPVGGVICFVSAALDAGIASVNIADGEYIGQKMALRYALAAVENTTELVPASNLYVEFSSGVVIGTGSVVMAAVSIITFETANEFALLEWSGANWIVQTNAAVSK